MAKLRVGTSGWHYDHWRGPFYPGDAARKDLLELYARQFRAVEINNTFYALPKRETLLAWRDTVPDGFRFACKASRYITHIKKLNDPESAITKFFDTLEALGDSLGPVLFQLPPNWRVNVDRLNAFLEALPEGHAYVFEFRDASWFCREVYDVLCRHNAALCLYNMGETDSPVETTADLVYLRLHGPEDGYQGSYDDTTLNGWTQLIRGWLDEGRDVYGFFDNDQEASAPNDAARLKAMV